MKYCDITIRIPYADVDKMNVVYYAHYLVYFERGRTEFMREMGIAYRSIESTYKLFLPVKETHLDYTAPARYDDLITIRTYIRELRRASIVFSYEVLDDKGNILVRGRTHHVFINKDWKPERIPKALVKAITPHVQKPSAQ